MHINKELATLFTADGGLFCTPESDLRTKAASLRALVLDWDGVFNDGGKGRPGGSLFGEADSMGLNLLRFCYYLTHQRPLAICLLSGERSENTLIFGKRERITTIYCRVKHKVDALNHLQRCFGWQDQEIGFVFDDVADLGVASRVGLRFVVRRAGSPLFARHVSAHKLADYITAQSGGKNAVREVCELLMGLSGQYDTVVSHRVQLSDEYRMYSTLRDAVQPTIYEPGDQEFVSTP